MVCGLQACMCLKWVCGYLAGRGVCAQLHTGGCAECGRRVGGEGQGSGWREQPRLRGMSYRKLSELGLSELGVCRACNRASSGYLQRNPATPLLPGALCSMSHPRPSKSLIWGVVSCYPLNLLLPSICGWWTLKRFPF